MVKLKTTPRGGSSHRPAGMATATFTGTSRGKADPEEQFKDAPGKDTEDSQEFPKVLQDAEQPKEGEQVTSKSKGKTGDLSVQAKGGADAPPEETPPNPNPTDPQPGTSKDPTEAPTEVPTEDPTQTTTQNPDEDTPPDLTEYVKAYKAAGKVWLDTVVDQGKQAYITLFDILKQLGSQHIDYFYEANREQVFNCNRDKTGRFLSKDEFTLYVEQEEEKQKPRYNLTGDAKEALKDYYDVVHTLSKAQKNFASSTQVLEEKIADKSVFLSIIQQVQLPAVQVQVRTVEELEKLEGKTYRELTLSCHLRNFRRIFPYATEQTRMMAVYMYFVLHEQITGLRPLQTGCSAEFRCGATLFKRLITGKKQPNGPGRLSKARGGSSRKIEEVVEMEGATSAKQRKKVAKPAAAAKAMPAAKPACREGKA